MNFEWDFSEFTDFANQLSDVGRFEKLLKETAEEVGNILLEMLRLNTPVKTGKLRAGWTNYEIKQVNNGYEVTLTNPVEYARWVNDGHYSYNQYGGAYFVQNRTPKIAPEFGTNDDDTFVFGHFFVEITLWKFNKEGVIEDIIYEQLQKWWEGCLNG